MVIPSVLAGYSTGLCCDAQQTILARCGSGWSEACGGAAEDALAQVNVALLMINWRKERGEEVEGGEEPRRRPARGGCRRGRQSDSAVLQCPCCLCSENTR
jgi:hypothetical protein